MAKRKLKRRKWRDKSGGGEGIVDQHKDLISRCKCATQSVLMSVQVFDLCTEIVWEGNNSRLI